MTIQRQYSLPNCTLVLEGLSESTTGNGLSDVRPVMSILVNSECRFAGDAPLLSGGRDFFESLVKAVSRYAQEFLSGIHHLQDSELVQLRQIDRNLHRLSVQNRGNGISNGASDRVTLAPIQVDLTTVQLFDLVEAVDQFLADTQTLPDISLHLTPVSKQYAKAERALVQRAAPVAVGVSSLALAAAALFFIPIDYKAVEEAIETAKTQQRQGVPAPGSSESNGGAGNPASPSASETIPATTPLPLNPPTSEPTASASPSISPTDTPTASASPSVSPTDTPTASASPSVSPTDTPQTSVSPSPSNLQTTLVTGVEISDPNELRTLERQLNDRINATWENRSGVTQDLVYRVSVDRDGKIIGYKHVNSAAGAAVDRTPLPRLLQNPVDSPDATQKATAQFKVVFTPRGVSQVSPWNGNSQSPTGTEIRNNRTLRDLQRQLRIQIVQNKEEGLKFPSRLTYRVALRSDGTIADYEPQNQNASEYVDRTPLPKLKSASSPTSGTASQEPLAYFRVDFTTRGIPEISPWRGYR